MVYKKSLFNTSRHWRPWYTREAYSIQVDIGDQVMQVKLIQYK